MNRGMWDASVQHRRGLSMHNMSGAVKDKDEDLALFHEMRARERNNFLHPCADDEASLSNKFVGLSGFRQSAQTPKKGLTDLLISESDKNDYDWLLTPPGTPLFPTLDRDLSVISPAQRDLSRWPSAASKTSRLSNGQLHSSSTQQHASNPQAPAVSKPTRANPSPRRPSTPSSMSQVTSGSKTRPLGTGPPSHGSRPATPTGRPSTPNLARPSTPTGRSTASSVARPSTPTGRSSLPAASRPSTPTRRMSTGSPSVNSTAFSNKTAPPPTMRNPPSSRGSSPMRKTRPVTTSPATLPGFSSDPPPNLRTSMPERPSSNSRGACATRPGGSSVAGRAMNVNSDAADRSRRRAPSPSLTRSYISPANQECSSSSKGSIISGHDDGLEVSRSGSIISRVHADTGIHARKSLTGGQDALASKSMAQVKRPTRTSSSKETAFYGTSISKKSLDTAIRHMDIRRSTPGGFRPLMSGSPTSFLYTKSTRMPASSSESSPTSSRAGYSERSPGGYSERSPGIVPDDGEGSPNKEDKENGKLETDKKQDSEISLELQGLESSLSTGHSHMPDQKEAGKRMVVNAANSEVSAERGSILKTERKDGTCHTERYLQEHNSAYYIIDNIAKKKESLPHDLRSPRYIGANQDLIFNRNLATEKPKSNGNHNFLEMSNLDLLDTSQLQRQDSLSDAELKNLDPFLDDDYFRKLDLSYRQMEANEFKR